jgi:large subunit ribosomal protein L13
MKRNKTVFFNKESVKRDWYLVDAKNKTLGRMATKVATVLRGKHKAIFSPNADCGDFVIILNAEKVRVTGKKREQKMYFTHSGYPGHEKLTAFEDMIERHPVDIIQLAVAGMLPKNRLGRQIVKKLKVYTGDKHPHQIKNLKKMEV